MNDSKKKVIGVWMSEKKSQKLNWKELYRACALYGYNLVKIDLEFPLEDQGHFDVFLHKLTDVIAAADQGDTKASCIIGRIEQFLSNHPNIKVIDPLEKVRILLNRYQYYSILKDETSFQKLGIFTPAFAEFTTNNINLNTEILRQRGVKFPVICKPTVAHGSKSAHEMILVFNENGLRVCKPPCVVQSFVNHNAVLHKVFLIGNRYNIRERPSLKNFYASNDLEPIFYSTGEVCKADSQSTLSILDPHDQPQIQPTLNEDKVKSIITVMRREIGLLLAGFDVVIDNETGKHAVIDINVFPSYDNFPNFFVHLLESIDEIANKRTDSECDNGQYSNSDSGSYNNCDAKYNGFVNVASSCKNVGVTGMNVNLI